MARPGRKSAAQTPAPPSERIKGSSKNPKGTASSKKSASGIRFSAKTLKSLSQKRDEHNSKYKRKASLPQLKAVYRRGLGAFSSSHRPTITGGAPNSRNAWAMARVNKFLMKLAGKKVKAAYVQDDDLMEDGGVTKETTTEFMNWFAGWVKPLREKMNIGMSIPNEYSQIKGVDDFVFLDVFEKIGQDIDAKPHLKEILSKADELGVSVVLEPIPRHNQFLDDAAKRKKIDRQYLIGYYSKFGFSLMDNGLMHRMPGSVMADSGGMNKLIVCRGCGWRWNTADSDESDKYVCHQCGFDNRTYYDSDPIGNYHLGGEMSKHLAPNGKPSNLTHEQWHLVRTPEFKAWFGDWENDPANASKVVDENGEPMVVWHTSRNDFNTFKTKNVKTSTIQGHSIGAYFSNLEKESKRYGDKTRAFFLNIKKPLDFTDIKEDSGKNGVSRFVERLPISDSLKNSIVYNSYHPIAYMILENADKKEKIISKIKKKNDGIVFYENNPSITFVAFEPNQIKLADGSNVTFDPNNPDIRYEKGGQVNDLINQGMVELKMFNTTPEHAKEYGLDSKRPLYLQKIYISKHNRLKGIGSKVIEYIIDYAKKNEHDLIFGHITQKAEPNIDVIKSMLREAGFNTIEGNNDFYKTIDTKYAHGGLIAPNGKPSNLSPEQYSLVRTPEFKAWFGDWENDPANASKVVDENGEPLIVWHSSINNFDVFNKSKSIKGLFHFGTISQALDRLIYFLQEIGIDITPHFENIDDENDEIFEYYFEIAYWLFMYVYYDKEYLEKHYKESLLKRKQKAWEILKKHEHNVDRDMLKKILSSYNTKPYFLNIKRLAETKDVGEEWVLDNTINDGYKYLNVHEGNGREFSYVVFEPNQIKLADGSNVTFDPNNPDIRYHLGGEMSKHLAPNGKPSNLTHEQWHLVRTPEFKAWFGDWENDPKNASKVLDDNGEPLLLHRGNLFNQEELGYTFKLGNNFLKKRSNNQFGFFFTNKIDIAKKYMLVDHFDEIQGGSITSVFINSNRVLNLLDFDLKIGKEEFISGLVKKGVQFEKEFDDLRKRIIDYDTESHEYWGYNIFDYFDAFPELRKLFIKNGFDSVIFYEMSRMYSNYKSYVVFNPNQIKLADGSNVTFDPNNPDIRYKDGGQVQLLAPNGKPSNLTPEQYKIVRTPEFKAWFGDWETQHRSKLVSQEDGRLIYEGVDIGILETQVVEDKVVEIDRLYIDDKYQKKGIGRACIKYVFDKYGCDKIIAYPHPKSDPFWLKSGVSNITMDGYFEIPKSAYDCSKIVDENGEPKVVYHGSRSQFTTFDLSKGGESNTLARVGFWFSPNEGFGLSFTAGTWWGDIKGDYGIEYAVFLSIKNPKLFVPGEPGELFSDSYERFKTDIYALAGQSARDANIGGLGMALNNPRQTINDYRSMLKKDGYDGILIKQTRFDKRTAGDLNDQIVALYPEQIKLADGSNTTFDLNNPDIRFDEGGKIEKMAETLELTQNSAQYAAGGSTDDCGCGDKAEFGMETNAGQSVHKNDKVLAEVNAILDKYGYEAIKKGEYPIGKVAKGMTIEDIARRHRFPIQDMKKSLELGIRTEKEHTNDQLIAEKIALDHLYEDAEYYQKLQKIEKLYKGSEIDYDFNPMDYYVERDDKRTSVSLYLRDEKIEANNVLFSNEMKLSKAIICREKINHAIEQENKAINSLEKNFWQAVKNIWENCMVMLTNHYYHAIANVENSYSLQDVYTYANGGLAYGNSHSKGGIPLYNKGSKSWIEIEGGEGVVKKESMHMNKALEFEGKKMSACEIVSQINQMTGGVKFKCADVKKIMDNDGNYD